ncbi:MAG: hypothetical protein J0L87_15070 [Bacteroidetes bacterium]|nr:hypothetical protein [Bacteroidota bacterium]
MKTIKIHFLSLLVLLCIHASAFSQGCSDAGFCTAESFKPNTVIINNTDSVGTNNSDVLKNIFKISLSTGTADRNITIYGANIEYSRILTENLGLNIKLASLSQSGKEHTTASLSDIYINGNYKLNNLINFSLGVKLPLNNANEKEGTIPLPMDYQSSLGTVDAIAGLALVYNKLKIVVAAQQPVKQNNNSFLQTDHDSTSEFYSFQSTNKYIRKGDVLLRVAYMIPIGKKIIITPSVLPIYHLQNDEYTDRTGVKRTIDGSEGLTLNGNLVLEYHPNQKNGFEISFGTPFITRKVRPDGLTRKYVLAIEYKYNF